MTPDLIPREKSEQFRNKFFKIACLLALCVPLLSSISYSAPSALPFAPTDLTSLPVSSTKIQLSWKAPAGGSPGYRVYRNGSLFAATVNTFITDSGLTSGQSYTYTVTAVNAQNNESAPSAAVTETTLANTPPVLAPAPPLPYDQIRSITWYDYPGLTSQSLDNLKKSLPLMKQTGFNTVWLAGNSWIEYSPTALPSPVYNAQAFTGLRQILDHLRANNMKAMIGLNYLGQGWSPSGIDFCTWTSDLQQYKAFEAYVQRFLTELNGYEDMVYITVFTENSGFCSWSGGNPPDDLAPVLQATLGSLPRRLPSALRSKFRIGYHDYLLVNLLAGSKGVPMEAPMPFDFLSMVGYGLEALSQSAITTELDWRRSNFTTRYPGTPLIMGEVGANECAPYDDGNQARVDSTVVVWAKNKPMGFNLWQWKSLPPGTEAGQECFPGNPGLGINQNDGVTPRQAVPLIRSLLGASPPTPAITILSPANGPITPANPNTASEAIGVNMSVTDMPSVSRIELYIDGTLKQAFPNPTNPLFYAWMTYTDLEPVHILTAKAYDTNGTVVVSSPVVVTNQAAVPDLTGLVSNARVTASLGAASEVTPKPTPSDTTITFPRSLVDRIVLVINQSVDGRTRHEIYGTGPSGDEGLLFVLDGFTANGHTITRPFTPPLHNITKIRVRTTHAPGAVGWHDLRVFGTALPGALSTSVTTIRSATYMRQADYGTDAYGVTHMGQNFDLTQFTRYARKMKALGANAIWLIVPFESFYLPAPTPIQAAGRVDAAFTKLQQAVSIAKQEGLRAIVANSYGPYIEPGLFRQRQVWLTFLRYIADLANSLKNYDNVIFMSFNENGIPAPNYGANGRDVHPDASLYDRSFAEWAFAQDQNIANWNARWGTNYDWSTIKASRYSTQDLVNPADLASPLTSAGRNRCTDDFRWINSRQRVAFAKLPSVQALYGNPATPYGFHDFSLFEGWTPEGPIPHPNPFDLVSLPTYPDSAVDCANTRPRAGWIPFQGSITRSDGYGSYVQEDILTKVNRVKVQYPNAPLFFGELGDSSIRDLSPTSLLHQAQVVTDYAKPIEQHGWGLNFWAIRDEPPPPPPTATTFFGLFHTLTDDTPKPAGIELGKLWGGDMTAPSAPSNVAATRDSETEAAVSWSAATDAGSGVDGYRLDVSQQADFSSMETGYSARDIGRVLTTRVTGLTSGTAYYVRLRAYDVTGNLSSYTVPVAVSPTQVAHLNAGLSNATTGSVTLSWSSLPQASNYKVDLSYDSGFRNAVANFQAFDVGGKTQIVFANLFPGTPYYARVVAYDAIGSSLESATAQGATLDRSPTNIWSGPAMQVSQSPSGGRLIINGQPVVPVFLGLNSESNAIANGDWSIFDYELQLAASQGIPLVSVHLLAGSPSFLDQLAQHMAAVPQALLLPRVYLGTGYLPGSGGPDVAEPQVFQSLSGGTVNNTGYTTLSDPWLAQRKAGIDQLLDELNNRLPGRIAGLQLAYAAGGEWFSEPHLAPGGPYYADYAADIGPAFCDWMTQNGGGACTPPTVRERSQTAYGSLLVTDARAIAFNRFYSERVVHAIDTLSREVKRFTGGRGLTVSFYGYHYELNFYGANPSSGHLALEKLLQSPSIDAFVSPYSYQFGRFPGQPLFPMGPIDSAALHGKLWLFEGDSRTSLCTLSGSCDAVRPTLAQTLALTRRDIVTAALHSAGTYLFDLPLLGWFGRPDAAADSRAIWDTVAQSVVQVSKIDSTDSEAYVPEVAIFTDESSLGLLPVRPDPSSNGAHPSFGELQKSLVFGAASALAQTGAPVRYYALTDLLNGSFPVARIKMAVFLNTFKMSTPVRLAIANKLRNSGKTLVFLHGSGLIGDVDAPTSDLIADITGLPVKRGGGAASLTSSFLLNGWSETFGVGLTADPWFFVDTSAGGMTVLGRYQDLSGNPAVAVLKDFGTHKVAYVGSSGLSARGFRALAQAAGVHFFSDQAADVVDARGNTLLLHSSVGGARTLKLPSTVDSLVKDTGVGEATICSNCSQANVTLAADEVAVFRWKNGPPPAPPVVESIVIMSPAGPYTAGQSYFFQAVAKDQLGAALSPQPTILWSVAQAAGASIDAAGQFIATTAASYTIIAQTGGKVAQATINVTKPSEPPPPPPPPPTSNPLPAPDLRLPEILRLNSRVGFSYPSGTSVDHFSWSFIADSARLAAARPAAAPQASVTGFVTASPAADLSLVRLTPGPYLVSVAAVDTSGTEARSRVVPVTMVADDLSGVNVYPNPWREARDGSLPVTFESLPVNAEIKIFTVSARLVRELGPVSGRTTWDLKNDAGEIVASGIYLYLITEESGRRVRGKLVIIR